mmetsp:Transcript_71703/g.184945  ORF Transcript_71703/g.184945 Transcript_71703/m.184945 type:complete len:218 (+) Transcript_71703:1912-2565(+)
MRQQSPLPRSQPLLLRRQWRLRQFHQHLHHLPQQQLRVPRCLPRPRLLPRCLPRLRPPRRSQPPRPRSRQPRLRAHHQRSRHLPHLPHRPQSLLRSHQPQLRLHRPRSLQRSHPPRPRHPRSRLQRQRSLPLSPRPQQHLRWRRPALRHARRRPSAPAARRHPRSPRPRRHHLRCHRHRLRLPPRYRAPWSCPGLHRQRQSLQVARTRRQQPATRSR